MLTGVKSGTRGAVAGVIHPRYHPMPSLIVMATERVTRSRLHPNREHHTSKMRPAVGSRGAILTEQTLGSCRPTSGDSHLVIVFGIVRNSALLRLPAAIVVEPGGQKLLPIEGKIRSPLSFATSPLSLRSRCAFPPPGSPVRRRISFRPVVGHSSATASSARRTFSKGSRPCFSLLLLSGPLGPWVGSCVSCSKSAA